MAQLLKLFGMRGVCRRYEGSEWLTHGTVAMRTSRVVWQSPRREHRSCCCRRKA